MIMNDTPNRTDGSPAHQDRTDTPPEDKGRSDINFLNGPQDRSPSNGKVLSEVIGESKSPRKDRGTDKPVFDCKTEGVSYKSWAVLKWGLDLLEIDVRYNLRSERLELDTDSNPRLNSHIPKYASGWKPANDELHAWIRDQIHERFLFRGPGKNSYNVSLQWTKEKYYEVLDALGGQPALRIDPLREYLDLLIWDKTPRLDTIMSVLFGCEQTDKAAWFGLYLFGGVVKRTINPGAKLDGIPILAGPQSIGKSSFLELMLPLDLRAGLFSGSVNLLDKDKEIIGYCRGRAIVECGELAGIHGRDLSALKQFVAQNVDTFRKPYGRLWHDVPRTWIIVGTADKLDNVIPHDPAGNRRWPLIWLPGGNMSKADRMSTLDELREQLWAEAYYRVYVEREPVYWPDHLQAKYAEEHKRYERADEVLGNAIRALNWDSGSLQQFAEHLDLVRDGAPLKRGDQFRLIDSLKSCGYQNVQRRINGIPRRIWEKVAPVPPVPPRTAGTPIVTPQIVPSVSPTPYAPPGVPLNSENAENGTIYSTKEGVPAVRGGTGGTATVKCATCGLTGKPNERPPCLRRNSVRTPDCEWN